MTKKIKYRSTQYVQPVLPPKTKEQKLEDAWDNIWYEIKGEIKFGQEALDKFASRLEEDPANAFEWSSDAFVGAARVKSAKEVEYYLENISKQGDEYVTISKLEVIEKVRQVVYEEVVRRAKWPEHSTSMPHNLMSVELNAKRAEWLSRLDQMIAYVNK